MGGATARATAVWDSFTENMAEAAAVPPHRFFCHCCKGEVSPKLPVSVPRLKRARRFVLAGFVSGVVGFSAFAVVLKLAC